jgi:hypothetical protein
MMTIAATIPYKAYTGNALSKYVSSLSNSNEWCWDNSIHGIMD